MKKVAVVMGSDSDLPVLEGCFQTLKKLNIPYEAHVYSAHRTPDAAGAFAASAREKGFGVIIAAAGKAAHLAGGVLHDHGLAQGDLAIPGHGNLSVLLDCQNRRRVRFYHRSSQISLRSLYTASSLRKAALSADFSVFALACLK